MSSKITFGKYLRTNSFIKYRLCFALYRERHTQTVFKLKVQNLLTAFRRETVSREIS